MFRNACAVAGEYTWPVITYKRNRDGTFQSSLGACVVLNEEGWVLTAAHILNQYIALNAEVNQSRTLDQQIDAVRNSNLNGNAKRKRVSALEKGKEKLAQNFGAFWGRPDVRVVQHASITMSDSADPQAAPFLDLAAVRLEPFDPSWTKHFVQLKDLNPEPPSGSFLCRLGFPFWNIQVGWDHHNNQFKLAKDTFPIPRFAIEGILSRNINAPDQQVTVNGQSKTIRSQVLETTSPGLKGQSGGAIFDSYGHVWGIQGRTVHYPLGFDPPKPNDPKTTESQFLNAGQGASSTTIMDFLDAYGIKYTAVP